MRRILLLLGLVVPLFLPAQNVEFAPVGAQWYHRNDGGLSPGSQFHSYEVVKDTSIQGVLCRKIEGKSFKIDSTIEHLQPQFVYDRNDSVFYYNHHFDRFDLLYDFSAQAGDTLTFPVPLKIGTDTNIFKVVVDSITLDELDGSLLRHFHTTVLDSSYNFHFDDGYYERIGQINSFFLSPDIICCIAGTPLGPLRCYQDSEYHINLTGSPCDLWLTTDIEITTELMDISLYPNPTSSQLILECPFTLLGEVFNLSNAQGQVLLTKKIQNKMTEIDMGKLPRGIYFLQIFLRGKQITRAVLRQ